MNKVTMGLRMLKMAIMPFIDREKSEEFIEVLTDFGEVKLGEVCKRYSRKIGILFSLEDEEMEKQNIPKEKREDIRENIIEFINKVDIEKVSKQSNFDELELGKALANIYKEIYEQDMEYDYIYYQRILYSLSNCVLEELKEDKSFYEKRIIDCYRILINFQKQWREDKVWKKDITDNVCKIEEQLTEARKFIQIIDSLPEKRNNYSPFHYLCPSIEIYGREKELQELRDFINFPSKLLFWAILGPGGMGKSKLVHSFMQEYRNSKEWKMVFFPSQKLREVLELGSWEYPCNLLLVIDYAGGVAKELGEWVQKIANRRGIRRYKIRLLFLERQGYVKKDNIYTGEEEFVAPDWYDRLCSPISEGTFVDKESLQEYQYRLDKYPCMLQLESLDLKAHIRIMDAYAIAIKKEILHERIKFKILNYTENSLLNENNDYLKITPLFILFVTDAALNNKAFRNWDIKGIMQYVYERDYTIWEKNIREKSLLAALMEILVYTTSVKEWEVGTTLLDPLKESVDIVNKYRLRGKNDFTYEWISVLTGRTKDKTSSSIMGALEPDLVGEYYVLKRLELYSDEGIKKWCEIWLENTLECKEFFGRCIQDYGKEFGKILLKILSKMNFVINENIEGRRLKNQIHMVSFLWYQYYRYVLPFPTNDPQNRIKEFVERWKAVSQDAAELYTIVFYKNAIVRGRQKIYKFLELKKLYSLWPSSTIIAENYVDNLGSLVKYYYGSGKVEAGNEIVKILQSVIDKWGTNNEDVAISCANTLAKIIPVQFEMGSSNQGMHYVDVLNNLLNNWNNENFALYFIIVQGDIVITQGNVGEKKECFQNVKILCETIKRWGVKSEGIAWRAVDTIAKVFIRLQNKVTEETRRELLECLGEVVDKSSELSFGVIWHYTKVLDRIADVENITFYEMEYISSLQRECYDRINW